MLQNKIENSRNYCHSTRMYVEKATEREKKRNLTKDSLISCCCCCYYYYLLCFFSFVGYVFFYSNINFLSFLVLILYICCFFSSCPVLTSEHYKQHPVRCASYNEWERQRKMERIKAKEKKEKKRNKKKRKKDINEESKPYYVQRLYTKKTHITGFINVHSYLNETQRKKGYWYMCTAIDLLHHRN